MKLSDLAIRLGIAEMDPNPEPAHPNAPWAAPHAEDFAAESRAEVSKPKGAKR